MEKMGMRFVKQTPLPQIAAKNQAYSSQLFKAAHLAGTARQLGHRLG
jgi:hypothetical protein